MIFKLRTNRLKDQCAEDERGDKAAEVDSGKALRYGQIGLIHRIERGLLWLEHHSQRRKLMRNEAVAVRLIEQK